MKEIRDIELVGKIARVVKHLREKKGVSQDVAYTELGIHFGRIEIGNANISVSTISALCKYFKIKISDFFKLVEKQK